MQSIENITAYNHQGGRVSSAAYRKSIQLCEDFEGLEESINRYDLMKLVKRVGKSCGFTPRMIQLLDYYIGFTRDIDWEEGSRPIVYQAVTHTALDFGVTERQIQKIEKQLFEVGAISWYDSGNHRRSGQRDPNTGRILYAFGVDLSPLAYLKEKLEQAFHDKQIYDKAWKETKRQISWYRRQICSMLTEWEEGAFNSSELVEAKQQYQEIAKQIRTSLNLETLCSLLQQHKALHSDLIDKLAVDTSQIEEGTQAASKPEKTIKGSSKSEKKFAHIKNTNQILFNKLNTGNCFQGSVEKLSQRSFKQPKKRNLTQKEIILSTGLQHITLKQTLLATSDRFREHLPLIGKPLSFSDIIEAAYKLRRELHISEQSWQEACKTLGRTGAAICLIITDNATLRKQNRVKKPPAYFKAMINRAKQGNLRLKKTL